MIRQPVRYNSSTIMTRAYASQLVQAAEKFQSLLMLECGQKTINAKSLLGVLTLGADMNRGVVLVAKGNDEAAAVQALLALPGMLINE